MPIVGANCALKNLEGEERSPLKSLRLHDAQIAFPAFPQHYAQ
jgi:hypothetical protein